MKRSEINEIIHDSVTFLAERSFALPPFAFWSVTDWEQKRLEVMDIIETRLGWDVTDFGRGDFRHFGLVLFTIRNGCLTGATGSVKNYAEKVMIQAEGQYTPMHFHYSKMEDIINRGGGVLVVQVYNCTLDGQLAATPVTISCDGIVRIVEASTSIELSPGESISLPPTLYHSFWTKEGTGKVLIGEVSSVNDDRVDNYFVEDIIRFGAVEEDEPPLYLLSSDYSAFLSHFINQ